MAKTADTGPSWSPSTTERKCAPACSPGTPSAEKAALFRANVLLTACSASAAQPTRSCTPSPGSDVRLPCSALLGSLEKPADVHANLMDVIHRVPIGTIAIGCLTLPAIQYTATIGALYSLCHHVGSGAKRMPILAFRTQHAPILAVVANAYMPQAFQHWAIRQFCGTQLDARVRHGVAAVFKSVAVQHEQQGVLSVSERCGAQGLFAHNHS